ncbi:MAG: polysaccharide deacetylase family protein [Ferruginibacter sp.]
MSQLKNIFYQASSFLPMQYLQKISPVTTLLPYQHTVSDQSLPHVKHLYSYKTVKQFTADLETLLKHYTPVSPDDVLQHINSNTPLPKKTFLLTFDDGFREVYDIIAPLLQSKGVPALFFINPAFIDNRELFFRCKTSLLIDELLKTRKANFIKLYQDHLNISGASSVKIIDSLKKLTNGDMLDELAKKINYSFVDFLKNQRPFLTTENLISLKKRGFTIGAHSMNHPYYENLNLPEQVAQTVDSCNYVQQNTGINKQYFSFPYSDEHLQQNLFNELKKTNVDLLFGIQNQKEELNNKMLHRFNAERPFVTLDKQIKGILLMTAINKLRGKNKVQRN